MRPSFPVVRGLALLAALSLALVAVPMSATADPTITPRGTITDFASLSPLAGSAPGGIVSGPGGALWFVMDGRPGIASYNPAGVLTMYTTGISAGSFPVDLTVGPDGNMWFTESGKEFIGRITPDGTITEFPTGAAAGSWGITTGSDGAVWFTLPQTGQVGRMTMSGQVSLYPASNSPLGITSGPDGALWITDNHGGGVGRMTTDGEYTLMGGIGADGLGPITTGPDGALWFTDTSGPIGRITTSGVVTTYTGGPAAPLWAGIAAGPDGEIWLTDQSGNIDRLTPSGKFYGYGLPTHTAQPYGITTGPDGAMWFTEPGSDSFGRITSGLPSRPSGVIGEAADGAANVSWSAPTDAGMNAISRFTVTASPGGAQCVAVAATTCTVSGLSNEHQYTFTVTATNGAGTTTPSDPSQPVTPGTAPAAPQSVTAKAGNTSAVVTWQPPLDNGGSAVSSYLVHVNPSGPVCNVVGLVATCTGLQNGTPYVFSVSALNSFGEGASASANAVTATGSPSPPQHLVYKAGSGHTPIVSWSAPASNGGAPITSYLVRWSTNHGKSWTAWKSTSSTTMSFGHAYAKNTFVIVEVEARNSAGTGSWSKLSFVTK